MIWNRAWRTPSRPRAAEGAARGEDSQLRHGALRFGLLVLVLAVLWGLWEGWHWIGTHYDLTWPFPVNDITMPHLHRIVQALFQPAQVNGPWLIDILWHASLFTAKEALVGFALGARVRVRGRGAALAVALDRARRDPLRRRLADRAAARDRADGRRRARHEGRHRLGLGRDPRRVPDLLPGHDQRPARPRLGRPARASS